MMNFGDLLCRGRRPRRPVNLMTVKIYAGSFRRDVEDAVPYEQNAINLSKPFFVKFTLNIPKGGVKKSPPFDVCLYITRYNNPQVLSVSYILISRQIRLSQTTPRLCQGTCGQACCICFRSV